MTNLFPQQDHWVGGGCFGGFVKYMNTWVIDTQVTRYSDFQVICTQVTRYSDTQVISIQVTR